MLEKRIDAVSVLKSSRFLDAAEQSPELLNTTVPGFGIAV